MLFFVEARAQLSTNELVGYLQMGVHAEKLPDGKPVLSPLLWDRLGSTPYGRNMDPDGSYVVKPVDPDQHLVELQRSHIPMDHYTFPRDREVRKRYFLSSAVAAPLDCCLFGFGQMIWMHVNSCMLPLLGCGP